MTAKEYLSQGRWLNQKILNRNDEIRRLRELTETIKATNYEQSIVQTSGKPDASFTLIVEKIADKESELLDEVERYLKFREKIGREIRQLPKDEEKILLEKRYISFKSWSAISNEMGYAERHILRLHAQALRNFEKIHSKFLEDVSKCH